MNIDNLKSPSILIDSHFTNDNIIYCLTVAKFQQYDGSSLIYTLVQFTNDLFLNEITLYSRNVTSVALIVTDTDGILVNADIIWQYDGIRQNMCYASMIIDSVNNIIILSNFVDKINIQNYIKDSKKDGNYFIVKLDKYLNLDMYIPISINNTILSMTIDKSNDIYIAGTIKGLLTIDNVSIKSSLYNDMFISKISSDGQNILIRSSTKDISYNQTTSKGNITATTITYNETDNTIIAGGEYDNTFQYDKNKIINDYSKYNVWYGTFDTKLNGQSLHSFMPMINEALNKATLSQIICNNSNYYLTGVLVGKYLFNNEVIIPTYSVYVIKINNNEFIWSKYANIKSPHENDWNPHIHYNNNLIYLNFFGIGECKFDDESQENGSGSLDNVVNCLNTDNGNWHKSLKIAGTITTKSINCISINNECVLVGSNIIDEDTTDGYLYIIF